MRINWNSVSKNHKVLYALQCCVFQHSTIILSVFKGFSSFSGGHGAEKLQEMPQSGSSLNLELTGIS